MPMAAEWRTCCCAICASRRKTPGFLAALKNYGISCNTGLTDMYKDFQAGREYTSTLNSWPEQSCRLYEPDINDTVYHTAQLLDSAKSYSDTAIVVLGRISGESNDTTQEQHERLTKGGDIVVDACLMAASTTSR